MRLFQGGREGEVSKGDGVAARLLYPDACLHFPDRHELR